MVTFEVTVMDTTVTGLATLFFAAFRITNPTLATFLWPSPTVGCRLLRLANEVSSTKFQFINIGIHRLEKTEWLSAYARARTYASTSRNTWEGRRGSTILSQLESDGTPPPVPPLTSDNSILQPTLGE
jgi:hypothetical protein